VSRATECPGNRLPRRRRRRQILGLLLALLTTGVILAGGAVLASAAPPVVTVQDASEVSFLSAQVKGTVDPGGEPATYRFQIVTDEQFQAPQGGGFENATTVIEQTVEGSGPQPVEGELEGLAPATTYHLRLIAFSPAEESGEAIAASTFTTKAVAAPVLTTDEASEVAFTTATASGTVALADPDPAFNSSCQFEYITEGAFQPADEHQTLTVSATAGTYTLSFGGEATAPLAFDATAAQVESALDGLTSIGGAGGSVTVTGGPGDDSGSSPYSITFGGSLAETDVEQVGTEPALLTGTSPNAAVETTEDGHKEGFGGAAPIACEPETVLGSEAQPVPVTAHLTGLTPATTYHLRLLATNAGGASAQAAPSTFTTEPVAKPTVSVDPITTFSATTAELVGHVTPNSPEPAVQTSPAEQAAFESTWHFECTPECPGLTGGTVAADDVAHQVTAQATGLLPGVTYSVVLIAVNAGGEQTSAPARTFTTPAVAPTILSTFATGVTSSAATLGAEIDPGGAPVTAHFDYITEERFQTDGGGFGAGTISTPESEPLGYDDAEHEAFAQISGLAPQTTYRYRVVAQNGTGGPQVGTTESFTTQAPVPSGSVLADGRAWEMVSPLDKNGADIAGIDSVLGVTNGGMVQASADGEKLTYTSVGAFAEPKGAPLVSQYLSTRTSGGWGVQNITLPINSKSFPTATQGGPYKAFSTDLSTSLYDNGVEAENLTSNPPLTADAKPGNKYYLRDDLTGALRALETTRGTGLRPGDLWAGGFLQGVTPDLHHFVFATKGPAIDLYESVGTGVEPINILPGGTQPTPSADSTLGGTAERSAGLRPLSADGSRAYFTDTGALYVREGIGTPQAETVAVGEGLVEPNFKAASADGSVAFFTAGAEGGDLYRFDLADRTFTDISVDPNPTADCRQVGGAEQCGTSIRGVLGTSEDGSYVYFVANGVLTEAPNPEGRHATPGDCVERCNLYVWHDDGTPTGHISFIASLSGEDESNEGHDFPLAAGFAGDWNPLISALTARVSPDGTHVVFMSSADLTSYDNSVAGGGPCDPNSHGQATGCEEVYDYDASGSGHLTCVSCNPTGARPLGFSAIPAGTQFEHQGAFYQSRVLTADGARVFFNSRDALVPQDTNGAQDVYEWEEDGIGSCAKAGGCVSLVSSGTDDEKSEFVDAGESGDDVFFDTRAQLVPGDNDQLTDVYDARAPHVPGEQVGFPAAPPPPPPCVGGEACHGDAAPAPAEAGPTTSHFSGPGNPTAKACPKAKTLKKGKCVKKSQPKKKNGKKGKHKKHKGSNNTDNRKHHQQTNTDRRAGK
jgi:hypothetical protein